MLYIYDSGRKDALDDHHRALTAANELRRRGIVPHTVQGKKELMHTLHGDFEDFLLIPFSFYDDLHEIIIYCNNRRIPVLTAHNYPDYFPDCFYSTVSRDTFRCMRMTLAYLIHITKPEPKIAFFGTTPHAYADRAKINSLYSLYSPMENEDIYFNSTCFSECFDCFFQKRTQYDAVICANSYIAVAFIKRLEETDPEYRKNLPVVSFLNTEISKLFYTPISIIEYQEDSIYNSVIHTYKTIKSNNSISSVNIHLENDIRIRGSSWGIVPEHNAVYDLTLPYYTENRTPVYPACDATSTEYVNDPSLRDIVLLERLLYKADILDLKIILDFLNGMKNVDISEELYVSIQTIQYRSREMFRILDVGKKGDFIRKITQYICADTLTVYINKRERQETSE